MEIALSLCSGILLGGLIGFLLCFFIPSIRKKRAESNAEKIIKQAEIKAEHLQKNAQLDAKQQANELKQEALKDLSEKKKELVEQENRLLEREKTLNNRDSQLLKKEETVEEREKICEKQIEDNKKRQSSLDQKINFILIELQKVASLTEKEAQEEIYRRVEEKEALNITKYLKEKEEEAESKADEVAKDIIANAIARHSQEVANERTITVISLPNDEMKGRIIGREGRNIKSLENALGVDVLIDDTPEAITISCFNPIRRKIASRAIQILIKDGRIQPGRIEEVVAKCQKEVDEQIRKAGEDAVFKLGIGRIDKELVYNIGKLKYRTSYGQNQLEHSIETAKLCGVMAAELGLNEQIAKRAGLLHDIGKALDFDVEGSHVEIGARLAKKCGENEIVINAIEAHHGDVPIKFVISSLVIAADTLSAARPGSRSETLETYIKRLEQLEEICTSYEGVSSCYAIQSGREVRVNVIPDKISDIEAFKLAKEIKSRIENEMSYPGSIKVNVIREYRAIETAK